MVWIQTCELKTPTPMFRLHKNLTSRNTLPVSTFVISINDTLFSFALCNEERKVLLREMGEERNRDWINCICLLRKEMYWLSYSVYSFIDKLVNILFSESMLLPRLLLTGSCSLSSAETCSRFFRILMDLNFLFFRIHLFVFLFIINISSNSYHSWIINLSKCGVIHMQIKQW